MSDEARRLFEIRREQWFRQCRRDFLSFCTEVLSRQGGRKPASHHRLMISLLQEASIGKLLQLILAAPPGCGKSTYISYLYAAWYLAAHPGDQILACAHTEMLAASNSIAVHRIVQDFGDVLGYGLASDAAGDWRTTNGGRYRGVGVGTAATGYRASLILIDDPVKGVEAAHSQTDRDRVHEWYRQDIRTRRTPGCPTILVQTRWHEDDLTGRLLLQEPDDWRYVRLAAISEGDGDPLNRPEGTPLWADDSYGYAEDLLRQRAVAEKTGQTAMWWALYQGSPRPPEGRLFKIGLIPIRDLLLGAVQQSVRAWDLASTAQGDWTVGVKLVVQYDAEFRPFWTVVDVQRFRGGPEDVRRLVRQIAEADGYAVRIALPEDPGQAGKSQVFDFTKLLTGYPLTATRMTGSKELRALSVAAQFNIGRVGLLKAPWNTALLDELAVFPSGKHDDQVDALSLAFSELAVSDLSVWMRL
jgi:predicted phage terminase large subunit-like protein